LRESSQFGDTSTEDEYDRGATLPPLKHQPFLHVETKVSMNPYLSLKQKSDSKKHLYNNLYKPSLQNQYLYNKKGGMNYKDKPTKKAYNSPDFLLYGKKAN